MSAAAGETATDGPAAIGAVLAGGAGRRLGGAKAALDLAGRPLISYPLAAVEGAGLEPVVVAKRDSRLPPLECRVIHEPDRPQHPLCGVLAALRSTESPAVVVVGCDMPFASSHFLAWLGSAPEPLVVPSVDELLQPLLARYAQELAPALEEALASSRAIGRTVESLRPRVIDEVELARFDDPRRLCFNVNTPADAERARQLASPGG